MWVSRKEKISFEKFYAFDPTTIALFSDEMKELSTLEHTLAKNIHNEIGLRVNVTLVEPESLPRSEGKAIRVIDERNFE